MQRVFSAATSKPNPSRRVRKLRFKTRGICLVLKASNKVIGKAKIIRLPTTLLKEATTEPQIQHIVQVDIGQQRRKNRALRHAFFAGMNQSVFHKSALEHTLNQPDNSFVSNPMTQKLDHPFMVNLIEEAPNIGFHNIVDTFLLDRSSERHPGTCVDCSADDSHSCLLQTYSRRSVPRRV